MKLTLSVDTGKQCWLCRTCSRRWWGRAACLITLDKFTIWEPHIL